MALLTRAERVVAAALGVVLAVGGSVALRPPAHAGAGDREQAVRQLLDVRARAVLAGDRRAFLSTVDPEDTALRRSQLAFFEGIKDLPLAVWRYDLGRGGGGAGATWDPGVTLQYALAGFDALPVTQVHPLRFVRRDNRWYVATPPASLRARQIWDGGPVRVHRGRACMVLAHPAGGPLAQSVLASCERAVPHVTRVWGTSWSQRVVVQVPDSAEELAGMVPVAGDLTQIAAVATSELRSAPGGGIPQSTGDRVHVNPEAFTRLSASGREVVLRHEITHVATRPATGPATPEWLIEGLADYVGYLGSTIPVALSARELRADVRDGRLPAALPADADFTGTRADLPQIYEQSWLAAALVADRFGQAALLRLYRTSGVHGIDVALHELGIGAAELTDAWRDDLRRRFR